MWSDVPRTCTHHGQIVPAIIKHSDERMAVRRKIAALKRAAAEEADRQNRQQDLPAPDAWKPSQAEIDRIKRDAARNLGAT